MKPASVEQKILVIDDEESICKFLRISLEANHFQVRAVHTAREGLEAATNFKPDLIILDMGLPDSTGLEVLKSLRRWSRVAVICLTVQDSDEQKVAALDAGADDYLTKPFSVPELLARIRLAFRHVSVEGAENPMFRCGPLEIDRSARLVRMDGREIKLTATEYEILCILAKSSGKVVTHRTLLREVWGPNATEHTHYIRIHLGQIRKKLDPQGTHSGLIETESGVGYRLRGQA